MYIDCKQSGFSLLEVSISMTLLSVMWIMLGLIHLQTLRDIKSSYYYSVANQHAVMLASAIQSHPYKWRQVLQEKISNDIASELPNGKLYIECHLLQCDKVTISWGEIRHPCLKNLKDVSGCVSISMV